MFNYAANFSTSITQEIPCDEDPFVCKQRLTYGNDLTKNNNGFCHNLLTLLAQGKQKTMQQHWLFSLLLTHAINLGPRQDNCRAAMLAAVSKTRIDHLMPIAIMVKSGSNIESIAKQIEQKNIVDETWITPFSIKDPILAQFIKETEILGKYEHLAWCQTVVNQQNNFDFSLDTIIAAIGLDLQLDLRLLPMLYQYIVLPTAMIHACEQTHKPITAGPAWLTNDQYEFDRK